MRTELLFFLCAAALSAEIRTLTLREAIDTALKQNPDVIIARLDEQKAMEAVRLARDPFSTKLYVGSGLAYTSGFPMSIEGSAPSLFQARAVQSIYNRPKSFEVAQARENARGAAIDSEAKREEIAFRTASLYLDAEKLSRTLEQTRKQVDSLERVAETVRLRVEEGRDLPVENKRAALNLAQSRQRVRALEGDRDYVESTLAVVLGFGADDRVRAVPAEREAPPIPPSEVESVAAALSSSKDVKRLESAMQAKGLELKGAQSARYPVVDLLAQYALFARFNNYDDFFRRFDRHNGQIGMSFQLPVLPGSGPDAQAARAQLDIRRLRTEINSTRDRIAVETRKAYQDVQTAEAARDVAKLDLDVAREQLSVALAQFEEGRTSLRQVEELRSAESGKWIAFYEAQNTVERLRWALLRQTGQLAAALK